MFSLTVVNGKQQGQSIQLTKYPFVIGKNQEAQMRLPDVGVWDDHLAIELILGESPTIKRLGEGSININSEPIENSTLRNGDLITIGAAKLRFNSVPAKRKSLLFQNGASWAAMALVVILEIFLVILLKQE
jgi:hypothetical protein